MSEEELNNAYIDHEAVKFSMGLALENPDDYNIDEMKDLIGRSEVSQEAVDKAMREDLASMPPEMQKAMKEMLKNTGVSEGVWKEIFGEDF